MFGPGKYLKTNAQRFRNKEEFSTVVPEGKVRIICSGDSFTFGYGVSNDHTWCQQLTLLNSRVQTVNQALGGYGIDQMYLWYKHNFTNLQHDIHLFAFITEDFLRMRHDRFLGYGKPVLDLQDNKLVLKNVPVPKRYLLLPYYFKARIEALNLFRLIQKIKSSFRANDVSAFAQSRLPHEIAVKIFEELHQMNVSQKNSRFVIVYLPIQEDYKSSGSDRLRQFLREEAAKKGWIFFDLVQEFKKLPAQQALSFFIAEGDTQYASGVGHYNEKGNVYIANLIYKKLLAIPEIDEKLKD
jgi:lysophospholipase L1-like esterase